MVNLFRGIITVLMLFFLYSVNLFPQGVSVKVSTDSADYFVGDFINLVYRVTHPKETVILFPQLKDSLKKLEIVEQLPFSQIEAEGKMISSYGFVVSGYDSGDVTIPPILIQYKAKNDTALGFVLSDPLNLTVHTFAVDTLDGAKDIKEPIEIPFNWNLILLYLAILILLSAAGYYLYKYLRSKKLQLSPELVKIKLPHEIALDELAVLENKKLWQNGEIKLYHTEITGIIRQYFESRFKLPALELTTSEVLDLMNKNPEAKAITDVTADFLNNADMVKFAKYIPMDKINEEMMTQAKEIVNRTIPAVEESGEQNV